MYTIQRTLKGLFLLLIAGSSIFLSNCKSKTKNNNITVTPVTVKDSIIENGISAKLTATAEFPTTGNAILINSLQEWMSETMGGSFFGQVNEGHSMLAFYTRKKMDSFKEFELQDAEDTITCEWTAHFKRLFENEQWITYGYDFYEYTGGAHGMSYDGGCSFRKTDGRRLDWGMFDQDKIDVLRKMIKDSLQVNYFKFKSNNELDQELLSEDDRYTFPLPTTMPLFMKDGIKFTYQQYEIVPYSDGIPGCTISYSQLDSLLSSTGKNLIHPQPTKK